MRLKPESGKLCCMPAITQRFPLSFSASKGEAMSTRLPLFNRALVLEAIALIVFAGLVIAFVHSVVPYLAD